ncbi:TetR/AcrR family transcriptional regulator [Rhodococcus sp. NPDC059234]|uniref:TetR/AcrR family transcriptional regulator n=1 Tax=Rhodococcus sp. NPDC059234 TaxID=3346781 RepID=UPI00366AD094
MTNPGPRCASMTLSDRILTAGEVVIAERGVDASLEEVARAAGSRNKSAVHYHFGSRDGLVAAIVQRRLTELETRRLAMLAEHEAGSGGSDVRVLTAMLVHPLIEMVHTPGATHCARFFERVRHHPSVADEMNLWDESRPAVRIIVSRLTRAIAPLPPEARRYRLEAMATTLLALVADYERAHQGQRHPGMQNPSPDDLVDVLTGLVTSPQSAAVVGA